MDEIAAAITAKLTSMDAAFKRQVEALVSVALATRTRAESAFPKRHGKQDATRIGPNVNPFPGFEEFAELSDIVARLRALLLRPSGGRADRHAFIDPALDPVPPGVGRAFSSGYFRSSIS